MLGMYEQAGVTLVQLRESRGLTLSEVAQRMGSTCSLVARMERGGVRRIHSLRRYVEALGGRLEVAVRVGDDTETVAVLGEPGTTSVGGDEFR